MKTEIIHTLQQKITKLYLVYMFIVFPLYYHNNYIDIMEAKRMVYIWGSGAFVIVMFVLSLINYKGKIWTGIEKSRMNRLLLLLAVVLSLNLVGCPDIWNSFMGYGAKCTGLLLYLLGIIGIYYIGKYGKWTAGVTWAMLFGSTVVGILQILNRWGIDPLHMYDNLAEDDIPIFISTIGQVNYNAAYNCMILGILMVLYMLCKERVSQIIYGSCMVILFAGAMCCCSNSAYLAILVLFYVLFWYAAKHVECAGRMATVPVLLEMAAYLIWKLYNHRNVYLWDTSEMIYNARLHRAVIALVVIFVLGCCVCAWMYKRKCMYAGKVWRGYLIAIMAGIPIGGAGILYFFTNHYNIKAQILWSSYRMEIWHNCVELLLKGNWWHKLVGWGFNCIYPGLETIGLHKLAGVPIMDAHNMLLNSLLTSGILGTVGWGVLLVYMFRQALQNKEKNAEMWVIISALIVYMAQGIFNGPQILTTPVFLLFLGLFASQLRDL